jgi:hypothetical protein
VTQHLCHAVDCNERVPPNFLMCARHWYMVPAPLRTQVWRTYRPGQEVDKAPTQAYVDAAREAINSVAAKEHKPLLPDREFIIKTLELMLQQYKGEQDAPSD